MAQFTQHKRTFAYTQHFKVTAVQLSLLETETVNGVAHSLDIHPYMLSRWRKEYREGKLMADKRRKSIHPPKSTSDNERIQQLEKELHRLSMENELLKKWQRYLAEARSKNSPLSTMKKPYTE